MTSLNLPCLLEFSRKIPLTDASLLLRHLFILSTTTAAATFLWDCVCIDNLILHSLFQSLRWAQQIWFFAHKIVRGELRTLLRSDIIIETDIEIDLSAREGDKKGNFPGNPHMGLRRGLGSKFGLSEKAEKHSMGSYESTRRIMINEEPLQHELWWGNLCK